MGHGKIEKVFGKYRVVFDQPDAAARGRGVDPQNLH